jgi:hypothetical protein
LKKKENFSKEIEIIFKKKEENKIKINKKDKNKDNKDNDKKNDKIEKNFIISRKERQKINFYDNNCVYQKSYFKYYSLKKYYENKIKCSIEKNDNKFNELTLESFENQKSSFFPLFEFLKDLKNFEICEKLVEKNTKNLKFIPLNFWNKLVTLN